VRLAPVDASGQAGRVNDPHAPDTPPETPSALPDAPADAPVAPASSSSPGGAPRVLIPPSAGPPLRPVGDQIYEIGDVAFGASWRAHLVVPPGVAPTDLLEAGRAELATLETLFSPWSPTSELSRFNAAPPGTWALSQTLWEALLAALDLGDDTGGAFDPTIGALVDLWGFGPGGRRQLLTPTPSEAEVAAALELCGWTRLRLNREARAAVQIGGMKLDLSGLAKGLAVERLSARLSAMGATSHLIDFDGDLKGRGLRPDARPWSIVLPTLPGPTTRPTVVAAADVAVSTSTVFRKGFQHGARIVSHLVDGRSGRAVDTDLVAVTVIHPNATRADALSTALMVMGPYEGPEWAEAFDVAALFTTDDARGRLERLTPAAEAMGG
jgi:FAD:protein FMN transferase